MWYLFLSLGCIYFAIHIWEYFKTKQRERALKEFSDPYGGLRVPTSHTPPAKPRRWNDDINYDREGTAINSLPANRDARAYGIGHAIGKMIGAMFWMWISLLVAAGVIGLVLVLYHRIIG
jgi:hypothetical protein